MEAAQRKQDFLDRLVIFLAKRDGIDKLVKTLQYVGKLLHWHLQRTQGKDHWVAPRAKSLEVACGLSRKAFRLGRWLSGLNAMRSPQATRLMKLLSILSNAGEMVYFFFDHFTWLSRIGVLEASLASRFSYISASGEAFGYIFFVLVDGILLYQGMLQEWKLSRELHLLRSQEVTKNREEQDKLSQQIQERTSAIAMLRAKRAMQCLAVAANAADFVIALADIRPNPFVTHAAVLGVSGLISAWSGWYRNWPN